MPLNTDNEQAVLDINYLTEKAEHLTQVTDLEVTKVETRKIFERIPLGHPSGHFLAVILFSFFLGNVDG